MQPLSTLNIENYQVLPIKRETLVNYLLLKPLFNPLNYIVLVLLSPSPSPDISVYGVAGAFRFIFVVIS
jgi:hypothetical protein